MKLYSYIISRYDMDSNGHTVAENKNSAITYLENIYGVDDYNIFVEEISEIDGYKIEVKEG